FIPGVLAAATMYILMRHYFLFLTEKKKWKKWLAATVFIVGAIIVVVIPLFFFFQAMIPKLTGLLGKTNQLQEVLESLSTQLREAGLPFVLDKSQISKLVEQVSAGVPAILGATANLLTNTVLAFFFLYFMLVQGKGMEQAIQ